MKMVIIEGFMLFNIAEIGERLVARLLVRLSYGAAKQRRMMRLCYGVEAKKGEFWKTEDCFDKVVWRNYVEQHGESFEEGDAKGRVDAERCKQSVIVVQEGIDFEVQETLRRAVDAILEALKGKC